MIGDVQSRDICGVRILECAVAGPDLGNDAGARALIGEAFGSGARWVVIPVARLRRGIP